MADLTKSFSDAFSKASKNSDTFGKGHKAQIDELSKFVDALNTEGKFSAEITGFLKSEIPVLDITEKASGKGQMFFIEFGFAPFGGSVTLQLSTGLNHNLLGNKKDGYDMKTERDRNELFAAIGAVVAEKCKASELSAAAFNYINNKKGQTP